MRFACITCDRHYDALPTTCGCTCGGLLTVEAQPPTLPAGWRERPLGVWRYKEFLPHHADRRPVTMGEGGTRLLDAPRLAEAVGVRSLWLKIEGDNPTGSFKDRGMTAAVSWAVGEGATFLGCASTGNTAASMAAYGARAGVRSVVLLPAGQVAMGKVAQSLAHGAQVLEVEGNFDAAMEAVLALAQAGHVALLNSKNPIRLEGQKTLMYEVIDQVQGAVPGIAGVSDASGAAGTAIPDRVVYPVGNAGNISAGHQALLDYQAAGFVKEPPRLTGVQAAGASPIADAIETGAPEATPVPDPDTIATAIRIGAPVSAAKALRAIRATDGTATAVPDDAITEAQGMLARLEGVFAEPASCASIAGLRKLVAAGDVDRNEAVVCVLTGNGLKDPAAAERLAEPPRRVAADPESILAALR